MAGTTDTAAGATATAPTAALWESRLQIVSDEKAARIYDIVSQLVNDINEKHGRPTITVYNRKVVEPRLKAYFSAIDQPYAYSGRSQTSHGWPSVMKELSALATELVPGHTFPRILANFYRNGGDNIGRHRDSDSMKGYIVSMTFYGSPETRAREERQFLERANADLKSNGSSTVATSTATTATSSSPAAKKHKRKRPMAATGRFERTFRIYDAAGTTLLEAIVMQQASAVILKPGMQPLTKHDVPKCLPVHCGRVNLTLREEQ